MEVDIEKTTIANSFGFSAEALLAGFKMSCAYSDDEVAVLLADLKKPSFFQKSSPNSRDIDFSAQFSDPDDDEERNEREHDWEETLPQHTTTAFGETDDDDGDWVDNSNFHRPSHQSKSLSGPRRKKAPSGTACEKHKRWKKRCPDDCPMRKPQHRKANPEPGSPGEYEQHDSNEDSDPHQSEDDLVPNHSPYSSEAEDDDDNDQRESFSDSPSKRRKRGSSVNRSKRRRGGFGTIACEKHTALHARCPPNCPERRPAKPHPRAKKRAVHLPSNPVTPVPESLVPSVKEEMEEPEDQMNPKDENDRTSNSKFKDKHKLLHAKCPANCPERMKRDRASPVPIMAPSSPESSMNLESPPSLPLKKRLTTPSVDAPN